MKSQADALLHVERALLIKDCSLTYPALKEGFVKDLDRLTLSVRTRGLKFLTLDLPNLDSLLIKGLETGRLVLEGPASKRVSKRIRVPRLFSGLWLRVFDRNACLKEDVDVTAIFFLRQLCCLGKKLAVECSRDRKLAAVEAYHATERSLRRPSFDWALDRVAFDDLDNRCFSDCLDQSGVQAPSSTWNSEAQKGFFEVQSEEGSENPGTRRLLDRCQLIADLVAKSIDHFDPFWQVYLREKDGRAPGFRHGPGAVAERLKNHEKSCFPNWPAKLEGVFKYWFLGDQPFGSISSRPINHELASRLIAVPKTAKGPRLIASEPTAHMYCQQGVAAFLVDRMRSTWLGEFIDLQDQDKSGELVLQASLDRKLATVDLSDASDRLTCWTVERMFRRNTSLLTALHAARTRYIRDDISDVPSFLKPRKFASQGTAVTFPVQSLVFLTIALAASHDGDITKHELLKLRNRVRVYGDDIIIPAHGYERLCLLMRFLQLKVNRAKSFVHGHFRESCGTDGYRGYDVTPVKPEVVVADGPESTQAVLDASNNFFNKGLWHAAEQLRTHLPVRVRNAIRVVGRDSLGYSGLASYSGSDESHLAKRWNPRLHRYEVRVWSIQNRTRTETRGGWPVLLDFFTSQHNPSYARVASEYTDIRKTRDGLSWEPQSAHGQCVTGVWPRKLGISSREDVPTRGRVTSKGSSSSSWRSGRRLCNAQ